MSEIVNCQYSKTIMDEPTCNAFDVNRYGEIICSEESCIILKLKEQLQAKEQECEKLKKKYNCSPCGCRGRGDYENLQRHYENAINTTDTFKQECQYFKTQLEYFKDMLVNSEDKLRVKEQECEEYKKKFLRFFNIDNQECWDIAFLNDEKAKYKQALDEIEQTISNFPSKGIQAIPQTQIECTQYFLSVSETKLQKILDIIHKAKDNKQ